MMDHHATQCGGVAELSSAVHSSETDDDDRSSSATGCLLEASGWWKGEIGHRQVNLVEVVAEVGRELPVGFAPEAVIGTAVLNSRKRTCLQ